MNFPFQMRKNCGIPSCWWTTTRISVVSCLNTVPPFNTSESCRNSFWLKYCKISERRITFSRLSCQFLGRSLVSWASKKQKSVALSTAEAEYIVAGHCCAQLLWMRQTLRDYGYKLTKVPLLCDNESAIRIADNPVEHSRTKHIAIRYHFLRDHQQRYKAVLRPGLEQ